MVPTQCRVNAGKATNEMKRTTYVYMEVPGCGKLKIVANENVANCTDEKKQTDDRTTVQSIEVEHIKLICTSKSKLRQKKLHQYFNIPSERNFQTKLKGFTCTTTEEKTGHATGSEDESLNT